MKKIVSCILIVLVGMISSTFAQTVCNNVLEIPTIECEALVAFYTSADGDNWTDNTDWLQTTTPCSWYGVTCHSGSVTELNLPNNQVGGSLPAEISDLTSLTRIHLRFNQLTGSIPEQIGNLPQLTTLLLDANDLEGSIPPQLGNLTELEYLELDHNNFTGSIPPELGQLGKLKNLQLFMNALTGEIPSQLGNLTDLQELYLFSNALSGPLPQTFGNLSNLTILDVRRNDLDGHLPEELTQLGMVQKFWFSETNLCEPSTSIFQTWLDNIPDVQGTSSCPQADLWIEDTLPDNGEEPNMNGKGMWMSQAIWIRNNADDSPLHQNPRYGQTNHVYVTVNNRGGSSSSHIGNSVELLWAYAATGQTWPRHWHSIGITQLPSIASYDSHTLSLSWSPPGEGHYCLLARVISEEDPMTFPETNSIGENARNNNNIACRNLNVIGPACDADLLVRNVICSTGEYSSTVDLFVEGDERLFTTSGRVVIDLGALFERWQHNGGQGEGVSLFEGTKVRVTSASATIIGIPMQPEEEQSIRVVIDSSQPLLESDSYLVTVKQAICGQVIGGVTSDVSACVSPLPIEYPDVTPIPTEQPSTVPEPTTFLLFSMGLVGLLLSLRRKLKR